MNRSAIEREVRRQMEDWRRAQEGLDLQLQFTDGATSTIVFMLDQITQDPSPRWAKTDLDAAQRSAINELTNILTDIAQPYRRPRWPPRPLSSWELWHRSSWILDRWCPIPKED